jgi:hypothetical protein
MKLFEKGSENRICDFGIHDKADIAQKKKKKHIRISFVAYLLQRVSIRMRKAVSNFRNT